ncbi:MAG: sulfotransferase [Gammaproteobacteria bacterium]|nr:sulfotransferase [Gammaproteobacteria bacterium]MDH3750641.1 sulfotransferase [Gammaproteobacteria bacterium]MDH3804915.1 sulfotransferase [Gammaproteobacteria bacterium]
MDSEQKNRSDAAATALESRVWELLGENDVKQAIAACEQLNRQFPDFASGWHTASHLALKLNNRSMALAAIEKAVAIEPNNSGWLLQRAMCLLQLGQMERVDALVTQLASRKMKTAYEYSAFGMLLTELGRREEAVKNYEKAAVLDPEQAKHYYNIACLQRTLGDIEAAERNFDKTVSLDPADYEAYKIRSELRRQTAGNNHVDALEELFNNGIDNDRGRVNICYALAKELEDLDEAERSFYYLKIGADTRRSYMQYDVQRDLDTIASIQQTYSTELFDGSAAGDGNFEAIFILGMPRTGTTLIERVLASHSDVFAAGELNNFAFQMMKLLRAESDKKNVARDEMVELTTKLDFRKLGEAYINSTRPFTEHAARFIDKMPLNYLYAGLIHLALPNAKIINLKRNPLDTCYAIYKQLFIDAYPFSYDLDELGRYFVAYHQLMEHWNTVLPGVVHTVEYEKLVSDIEKESRRLLDFCDLDWQPQCLRFYENKEASTTASTVQVRQPVYQSSVGKWRNYEKQLQPIVEILQQAGIDTET